MDIEVNATTSTTNDSAPSVRSSDSNYLKSVAAIQKATEELAEQVAVKEKQDQTFLTNLKADLINQTECILQMVAQVQRQQSERIVVAMSERFEKLSKIVERITTLESDLCQFRELFATVFQDVE